MAMKSMGMFEVIWRKKKALIVKEEKVALIGKGK
jgi:hypothetical protein